jgi:hypothetical protein
MPGMHVPAFVAAPPVPLFPEPALELLLPPPGFEVLPAFVLVPLPPLLPLLPVLPPFEPDVLLAPAAVPFAPPEPASDSMTPEPHAASTAETAARALNNRF